MRYKAVIFDMDGTILDTANDLTASVNYAMGVCGHRHDYVRADGMKMFGSGAHTALQRALAMEAGETDPIRLRRIGSEEMMTVPGIDEEEVARIEEVFRPYYLEHSMDETGPYDGIMDLLQVLRERGIRTAVVSNKPDPAVKKLADDCFDNLLDAAAGEQEGIRRKPAPDMVQAVLKDFGIAPEEALYIGDTEIDIQTAANTGMPCVCVSWGFRSVDFLRSMNPFAIIDTPAELLDLL
jgi:phosphoglycolate phosphatase